MNLTLHIASIAIALIVALVSWQVIPGLDPQAIQAIGSTASTISGILFGFVLASVTVLAAANGNTLIENTRRTNYLPRLLYRLQFSMLLLISVCFFFLSVLFIPQAVIAPLTTQIKLVSLIMLIGVFLFAYSVCIFGAVWREYYLFAKNL